MQRGATALDKYEIIAFVATAWPDRAKIFYSEVLGLRLMEDSPFAFIFAAGTTTLMVAKVRELSPAQYTVVGWKVPDIRSAMNELKKRGIAFERYDTLPQDELGVWMTPDGHQVCWFKDPDGNTLSLMEL